MEKIFLSPPHMSGKEMEYIGEVFKSNYIAPLGEYVDRFERAVRDFTGAKAALATNSATAAIHLALRVLGVSHGDEVLASTFTFIGSVAPILYQNATPVFIDSDRQSWNLDPNLLEEELVTRQRAGRKMPKVLLLTHLYGQSADMEAIMEICERFGVYVVEDAAESLGATYKGRQTGTFGTFGIYSFNGNKILTTSGGGVLVSDNPDLIEKARFYATQAREPRPHYEHNEVGYNYRLSNVLGAIGVAQMEVLDERIAKKREIFERYGEHLAGIDEISFMPELPHTRGNRWLTVLTLSRTEPGTVMRALEAHQIESRPAWKPMHMQPLFADAHARLSGVSQTLFEKGICLPSGTALENDDIGRICEIVKGSLL